MKTMILTLFMISAIAFGQYDRRNEVGTALYKFEMNSVFGNKLRVLPKFVHGVYYERRIGDKFSWTNSMIYGMNRKKDRSTRYVAEWGETEPRSEQLNEFSYSSGFKYHIPLGKNDKWDVVIGAQLVYQYMQYYDDPSDYDQYYQNVESTWTDYHMGGIQKSIGLAYRPMPWLKIAVATSGQMAMGTEYHSSFNCNDDGLFSKTWSFTPAEFRIGLVF